MSRERTDPTRRAADLAARAMGGDRLKPRGWLMASILLLITLAVFAPATQLGFVNFDDPGYVYANPRVLEGLTIDNVTWAFTTGEMANYHPLTWLSLMLDTTIATAIHGRGEPVAFIYHLVNVLIHGLNAALVVLLLHALTGSLWRSALAAALFALHPLRAESVVWVAERKDVLSTLFVLLAMLAYLRHARRGGASAYAVLLTCFTLSLLAKPMYVTLPFLLLLIDYWPLRRFHGDALRPAADVSRTDGHMPDAPPRSLATLILEKVPLLLLAAASSWVTIVVQRHGGAVSDLQIITPGIRAANAVAAYVFYIWKTIWPLHLGVIYPLRPSPAWLVALSAAILVGVSVAAVLWRRTRPWLAVGWFWYLGTLVPVIGLVQVGLQSAADRYTYFPSLGLLIAAIWCVPERWVRQSKARVALAVAAAVVLALLVVQLSFQIQTWRDTETLFRHAMRASDRNQLAAFNAAAALVEKKDYEGARELYRLAIDYFPGFAGAYRDIGRTYLDQGMPASAIEHLERAIELAPTGWEARREMARALTDLGRLPEAKAQLEQAAKLTNNFIVANDLGRVQTQMDDPHAAIVTFRTALEQHPDEPDLHNNLAMALAATGRMQEAIASAQHALKISPTYAPAHNNLGVFMAQSGRLQEAVHHFEAALKLDQANENARANLARARNMLPIR